MRLNLCLIYILVFAYFIFEPNKLKAQGFSSTYDFNVTVSGQFKSEPSGGIIPTFVPLPDKSVSYSGAVPFNSTAGFNFQATALQETHYGINGADINVRGYISNKKLGLALVLDSTAMDPYGNTKINFQWTTNDTWSLVSRRAGNVLPAMRLTGNFVFDATLSSEYANDSFSGDPFNFEVFTGVGLKTFTVGNNFITNGNTLNIDTAFGVQWANPGQTSGSQSVVFKAIWDFDGDLGRSEANGLNSLTLNSITFEDGTTPEDHGFDIVFASGRTSPNIVAVPEPGVYVAVTFLLCLLSLNKFKLRS